eukprot:Nitzschia sp. Nitz4//scaffold28_size193895//155901//156311//NITZ4_001682-RA/size193895-processed-gene-0.38-mRNA-1//1//CDS//3329546033//2962//frame0
MQHRRQQYPVVQMETKSISDFSKLPPGTVDRKVVKAAMKGDIAKTTTPAPTKGIVFMIATDSSVRFYAGTKRWFGWSKGEELVAHARSDFLGMELHGEPEGKAHIFFKDGTHYELCYSKANKRNVQQVIELLYTEK